MTSHRKNVFDVTSQANQGRRKHLKLGGHDTSRTLFLEKRGHFQKIKEHSFVTKSWGARALRAPSSNVYVRNIGNSGWQNSNSVSK